MKETGYYLRDASLEMRKRFIPMRRDSIEALLDSWIWNLWYGLNINDPEYYAEAKERVNVLMSNYVPYVYGENYMEF